MTDPTLAAQIEALAAKATQGKWVINGPHSDDGSVYIDADDSSMDAVAIMLTGSAHQQDETDAALIVALQNNLPAIVTALRQAEAAPGVVEALRLAQPIVEADYHAARDMADADWEGMSFTALEAVNEALARQHGAREQWQAIESAPKNGTFVLLFHHRAEPPVSMGYWDNAFGIIKYSGWMMIESDTAPSAYDPSHWMPLPAAPATDVGEAK